MHRAVARRAAAPALALALAGCSLYRGGPDIADSVWLMNESFANGRNPSTYVPTPCPRDDAVAAAMAPAQITACTRAMLLLVDVKWTHFQDQLMGITSQSDMAADTVLLGVGTAGSFVAGGASQILNAVSAGVTGLRSSFKQDVLFSHTILAIMQQMRADRATARAAIEKRLADDGYGSMFQAANDVFTYARAGSWTYALLQLQANAAAEAKKASQ